MGSSSESVSESSANARRTRSSRPSDEAIEAHQTARDILREIGDRHGEGTAWGNRGVALAEVRRFDEAIAAAEQALAAFTGTGAADDVDRTRRLLEGIEEEAAARSGWLATAVDALFPKAPRPYPSTHRTRVSGGQGLYDLRDGVIPEQEAAATVRLNYVSTVQVCRGCS